MADNHAVLARSGVGLVVQGPYEVNWETISTLITPSWDGMYSNIQKNYNNYPG